MRGVSRETLRVVDVASAALLTANVADNVEPVLLALMCAMGAGVAGLYWHDPNGMSWPVVLAPAEAWARLPEGYAGPVVTKEIARVHPGWAHCIRTRAEPFAVTDLVPAREWQQAEVNQPMRAHWGRNFQFAIPVYSRAGRPDFWVWVLGRPDCDFTPAERYTARTVQPILAKVTLHFAALHESGGLAEGDTTLLTQRELVVLRMAASDLTAEEIGRRLAISPRTVNKHLEHAYRKLDVHNRYRATELAVRKGLLQVSDASLSSDLG